MIITIIFIIYPHCIIRRLLYGLATSTDVMEEEEELEMEMPEEEIHRFAMIMIIMGIMMMVMMMMITDLRKSCGLISLKGHGLLIPQWPKKIMDDGLIVA